MSLLGKSCGVKVKQIGKQNCNIRDRCDQVHKNTMNYNNGKQWLIVKYFKQRIDSECVCVDKIIYNLKSFKFKWASE